MNQRNQKFYQWMSGRNGLDALAKTCLVISLILFIITGITRNPFLYLVTLAALIYSYFRIMSRNVNKRAYENQKFLQLAGRLGDFFRGFRDLGWKTRAFFTNLGRRIRYHGNSDRKTASVSYRIFKCPSCRQKVRVPRGHGKIEITCPKCGQSFIRRT